VPESFPQDLARYLAASTGLSQPTAIRVIADVASYFDETVEEFVLLLPQAREQDALHVAERLRAHIASLSIPVDDEDETAGCIRLTISVGVASVDGGESRELTDLLAAADSALYHAKETGRNKTHVVSAGLRTLLPAPRPAT